MSKDYLFDPATGFQRLDTAPKLNDVAPDEWDRVAKGALKTQVGGDHYKSMGIQPIEFIEANNLGFCEGNVVKYICRYHNKGGAEDLKKVIHYAQLLLELKYGEETS